MVESKRQANSKILKWYSRKKSITTADFVQESFKFPRLSVNISAEIVSFSTTLDMDMETFFVKILNRFFTDVENTQNIHEFHNFFRKHPIMYSFHIMHA